MSRDNKSNNKMIIRILLSVFLIGILTVSVYRYSYASWVEDGDGIHYKDEDGEYVTGFQTIEDELYFFDSNGNLLKGKIYVQEQDAYYYADENGKIQTGVIDDGSHFYVTDDTGKIQTGFVDYENQRYYFNSKAELVTGWYKNDDNWYYADENGRMLTGFIEVDGYRYYLNDDGVRVYDTMMEIDGTTYIFNKDGSVDENATSLYPLLVFVNEKRKALGHTEFTINTKVQSCAIKRASSLVNGYTVDTQDISIETMLSNRGVSCSGGYEFAYGGIAGYNMDTLLSNLEKDGKFEEMLNDDKVTDIGMGVSTQEDINYYDIILIKR